MNDDNLRRGTQREWLAAKIVLVGGFVIAIGVAAYFVLAPRFAPDHHMQANLPDSVSHLIPDDAKTAMMLFCAQELVEGKNVNIVPVDAQLAEKLPRNTRVKNRFACIAHTTATVYFITADYRCTQVTNPKCVQLYDIQTNDGLLIYRRRAK